MKRRILMNKKGVLFDMDGTLINTYENINFKQALKMCIRDRANTHFALYIFPINIFFAMARLSISESDIRYCFFRNTTLPYCCLLYTSYRHHLLLNIYKVVPDQAYVLRYHPHIV